MFVGLVILDDQGSKVWWVDVFRYLVAPPFARTESRCTTDQGVTVCQRPPNEASSVELGRIKENPRKVNHVLHVFFSTKRWSVFLWLTPELTEVPDEKPHRKPVSKSASSLDIFRCHCASSDPRWRKQLFSTHAVCTDAPNLFNSSLLLFGDHLPVRCCRCHEWFAAPWDAVNNHARCCCCFAPSRKDIVQDVHWIGMFGGFPASLHPASLRQNVGIHQRSVPPDEFGL